MMELGMEQLWLGLYVLMAVYGAYLVGWYGFWRLKGERRTGHITGFQKKKNKGKHLPILQLENAGGDNQPCKITSIDSATYWIKPLEVGEPVAVVCLKGKIDKGCIPGLLSLVSGVFLLSPALYLVIGVLLGPFLQSGFVFVFMAAGFIAAFLLFVRVVRFYY